VRPDLIKSDLFFPILIPTNVLPVKNKTGQEQPKRVVLVSESCYLNRRKDLPLRQDLLTVRMSVIGKVRKSI